MNILSKEESDAVIHSWVEPLENEIKFVTGSPPHRLPSTFPFEGRSEDLEFMWDVGACVVYLSSRRVGHEQFSPVLVVSEKVRRKQAHGVGHRQSYYATAATGGMPNFSRAITGAMRRSTSAAESRDELGGLNLPRGMMAARMGGGKYSLHVGTLTVTETQLRKISEIFGS